MGASDIFARSIATGTSSIAQGGNRESALLSIGLTVAGVVTSKIYQSVVKYDIDPASGGNAVDKNNPSVDMPVQGANNIGIAGNVDSSSIFGEGGYVSRVANQIPGVNAISGIHDVFQVRLEAWNGVMARNILNFPGMLPAAAITYAGIISMNPALSTNITDQIRK